jgi:hypothetical protein
MAANLQPISSDGGFTSGGNINLNGNLNLPLGSIVYETNIPDGALSGSAIALKPAGGTTANQQLLIYPTAADGDHIHMTSGNLYATELFLGSDNLYVKLANTGNVVINSNDGNSNTAMWTFDTAGNLTLPGNTFAVNYANGTQVSIGGGSGNTGNVTFSDQIVIGTGSNDGSGGLYLAPGNNSIANSALQYLRVRGGDVVTHIHLDTGNNAFYDQYFGNDAKYVKLEAGDAGNVVIGTDDANGNLYTWSFTSDGNLILAGGNSVIQSIANSSSEPLYPNVSTMVFTPDALLSSQSLVLDPTGPSHIHLRAPGANIDEPDANIFLGGEESSFEVGYYNGNVPNLYIHSGGNTWTFDNTGNITFPRDASNISTDPILTIAGGANPSISAIDASLAGPANLGISALNTIFTGFTGDAIKIYPDDGEISSTANLQIWANSGGNTEYSWTFDTTGNLTTPSNLVIGPGPGSGSSIFQYNEGLQILGEGANSVVQMGWTANTSAPDSVTTIAMNYPGGGEGNVLIAVGNNATTVNYWLFDNTGNLRLPGNTFAVNYANGTQVPVGVTQDITSNGAMSIMTYDGNLKYVNYATVEPSTGNITGGNLITTGSVTAANITLPNSSILTFGDTPVTNRYYVDATRTDTYTQNGSQARPFKTIAGAQAAIATAIIGGLNPQVEPVYIILLSNITENVTLATNHVYLIGQNGQIHQPIILTGDITVNPTSGTLNTNHFSITGLEVVGTTNGKAIYVTGASPLRLSLQDVWITANGTGAGLYQDNSGSGTYTHGGPLKVSHNGTGDVYCFDIRSGTASFDTVETSGATQVGAAGPGATLTFNNSQLDANGDVVVETYGSGVLVVTNSAIKNSQANGFGVKLNAVANVAGTVSIGQSAFNVPAGTGQAVWLDPNTTAGLSGVFAWAGVSFYPGTNTTINPSIIPAPLTTLVGTIAAPIIVGDITATGTAQDWDLIDNNASALSFDTTGKTGIINLVTTNGSEGVTMSGTLSVTGNANVGNLNTTTAIITTGNITTINSGLLQNGNSNITITSNGNVSIQAAGSNVELVVTSTGANVTGTLTSTGKIGYASGSTVTQTTNRGNGVTINALAGTIITTSASMVANQIDTFSVANDQVDPNNDIVLVQIVSPNFGVYNCIAQPSATISVSLNGFYINIVNISGFTTSSDAITIRFMVIKAPNA